MYSKDINNTYIAGKTLIVLTERRGNGIIVISRESEHLEDKRARALVKTIKNYDKPIIDMS